MSIFKRIYNIPLSKLAIIFAVFVLLIAHYKTQYYAQPDKVIRYDIKSYYAYFPAAFIEKDLKMSFLNEKDYPHKTFFWRYTNENGDLIIQYSSGMSILYFPFVYTAHIFAPSLGYEANGFTPPYAFAIIFSNFFILLLGLIFFRKFLLKFFSEFTTFIVLLAVFFGTNLYHYATEEPAMPHAYMFSLTSIYLYMVYQWHQKPRIIYALIIGLLVGVVSLTRPNDILIALIFIFWGVASVQDFREKVLLFLKKWPHILGILLMFFVVWIPQFIYWKLTTGQFLYYSYGPSGGDFYFFSPHFFDQLFSYRKGAIMYSPILFFAFLSILWVAFKKKEFRIPIILYAISSYWFLASWWSWWNGGGFGIRMYVDTYAVLFFSFAFLIDAVEKSLNRNFKFAFFISLLLLSSYGWFRNYQYSKGIIHFDTNTKEMYWKSLFATKQINGFWETVNNNRPDYFLARCGVYVTKNEEVDPNTPYGCMVTELRLISKNEIRKAELKKEAIKNNQSFYRLCKQKAKENCASD